MSLPPMFFFLASVCVIIPTGVDTINIPISLARRYLSSNFSNWSFLTLYLGFITPHLFMFPSRLSFNMLPFAFLVSSKLPTYLFSFIIPSTFLITFDEGLMVLSDLPSFSSLKIFDNAFDNVSFSDIFASIILLESQFYRNLPKALPAQV